VLDADGLNLLARTGRPRPRGDADIILTPHPGEFARLAKPLGITDSPTDANTRPDAAAKLARAHQGIVLLKGRHTIVTDGERLYINQTGNPALSTAGSGDILTGLIAALLAQGAPAFDAAVLGAYLHGLAADRWAERHGRAGLRAPDLADELPDAFEQHRAGT
jgi:NAD(P)H-hydrate epimerase